MKNTLFFSLMLFLFSAIAAQAAQALCVNTAKANIRTGPGTDYEIVWQVYRYMPFQKVGSSLSGDWYAVKDVDGDVSWVYRKLVTGKYRCVVVKTEEVNVRKGPSTKYRESPISPAKKYYSYRFLKRHGSWIKIRDDRGVSGWVHRKFLWVQ